uniref:DNA replication checkpoint mediator MRC1 domain-containing protein n=1 Tax=Dentipellis fragilis TaxID=205917 RepID=A0A4Y9YD13_9AGAM
MLATDSSSVVLDSTVSQPNSSPPPVRRAPVTYGRRRDNAPAPDPDTSAESHSTRQKTTAGRSEDEIVPDSDEFNVPQSSLLTGASHDSDADTDEDEGDARPGVTKFHFGWKKTMAEIDEMSDEDLKRAGGAADGPGSPMKHVPTSPAAPPAELDDLFRGSLSSLTESSSHASLPTLSSPSTLPATKRAAHAYRRAVIEESSDDEPTPKKAPSSPNTSPPFPHPITTPKGRSSPTPPTSEGDMSPAVVKPKGKARSRTVAPLLFDENIDASSAKESRVASKQPERRKGKDKARKERPLPKKQREDMQKETARLLADRPVAINTHTRVRPLSALLDKISHGVTPAPKEPTPSMSSDPIQSFSSPPARTPPPPSRGVSQAPPPPCTPSPFRPNGLLSAPPALPALPIDMSSDDEDMPSVSNLLREDQEARKDAERKKALAEMKQRVLALKQADAEAREFQRGAGAGARDGDAEDDDDDELEIVVDPQSVAREEAEERRTRPRPSEGRSRQLKMSLGPAKASRMSVSPEKKERFNMAALVKATRPAFTMGDEKRKGKARASNVTAADIDRVLLESAASQSQAEIRKKEEEWMARGGRVKEGVLEPKSLDEWTEQAKKVAERKEQRMMADEDSDSEDEDWKPEGAEDERGSASAESADEQEQADNETPAVDAMDEDDEEDLELPRPRPRPRAHRRSTTRPQAIDSDADSDSGNADDNENLPPPGQPPRQVSSEHTTDAELEFGEETDKENAKGRMFDRGEDKENKAVVRHGLGSVPRPSLGIRQASGVFGGDNSRSSSPPGIGIDLDGDENDEPRKPLKELLSPSIEADPFSFTPSKRTREEGANVLAHLQSPLPPPLLSFGASKGKGKRGLSQFFEDEEGVMDDGKPEEGGLQSASESAPAPGPMSPQPAALGGGFSQFFASGSAPVPAAVLQTPSQDPKPVALGGLADVFGPTQTQGPKPIAFGGLADAFDATQDISGFDSLRKDATEDISLTFTTQQLRPALDVDESLKQKAELIFEKEQEYVVEAATRPARSAKPELYINEDGFLTQTRPDVSTPEVYRPSPSQHPNFFRMQTQTQRSVAHSQSQPGSASQRQPLGTLAFSDTDDLGLPETPSQRLLQRLRRRDINDDGALGLGGYHSSPDASRSPSPSKEHSKKDKDGQKQKQKMPLDHSEFVDEAAVESDEDDMLGFGPRRRAVGDEDEEEGDEDQDKALEGLVDDAHISEDAMNEELVQEKFKEHQEKDDALDEKLARDAAAGKLRTKRHKRHGVDLDDSDSEVEDEDDKARRQRIAKKRRIAGDNLEDLGKNEATRPFYNAYHSATADNDTDFAYLEQDQAMDEDEDGADVEGALDGDAAEDGDEGGGRRKQLSAAEMREEMRRVAREERGAEFLDPNDVSWVDKQEASDDDESTSRVRVHEIVPGARRGANANAKSVDPDAALHTRVLESKRDQERMASWAKDERASFVNGGTGRGGAGAGSSVTGLGRAKAGPGARTGAGTVRAGAGARARGADGQGKSVKKMQKMSSVLSAVGDRSGRFGSGS